MISKKIVIMLLLLVLSLPIFASCKEEEIDEMDRVVYALSENGEYYICKGLWHYHANSPIDRDSELVIEAYICGKPVLEIANHAFYGLGVTKVIIPDTVKRIGDYAFYVSKNLKEVVLSKNLESIGDYAFSICPNLETITLPASLISIGKMCFSDNKSLKSLVIPLKVQNIGGFIFSHIENEDFKVYCEHKESPDTWDEKWYYGIDEKNIIFDYKQ